MTGVQGRPKGCKAEREVAGLLAAWWREHEEGVEFVRTPCSGGWSTPKLRGDFRASGDIMTTSKSFPFAVEVKRREGFAWSTLLAGKKSPVWGWWSQTTKAALEQDGIPMLWLRHNREPWRLMLPSGFVWDLTAIRRLLPTRFVLRHAITAREGPEEAVAIVTAAALLAIHPSGFLRAPAP